MSGTEEPITEESVKALRADRDKIMSNREKLNTYMMELIQKEEQIRRISQDINDNLHGPIKPWGLDLDEDREWDEYFKDADRSIQRKKDQDVLKEKLEGLERERKEIEAKIIPLIPSRFYGIKIKVHSSQQRIIVDGETARLC